MLEEQFETLIKLLKLQDLVKLKEFTSRFKENEILEGSNYEKFNHKIENFFYLALSKFLLEWRFKEFEHLFNYSDRLGIFIDVKKILNSELREKVISDLHIDGMQRGQIGNIFNHIRFFNKYNLFERDLSIVQSDLTEEIKKKDQALIANLQDLFGKVSNSLIFYACKIMPKDLYLTRIKPYENLNVNTVLMNDERSNLRYALNLRFLKRFTDGFTLYGLSIRYLSSVKQFLETFNNEYVASENKKFIEFDIIYPPIYYDIEDFHEYHIKKRHFVSPTNILKNQNNISDKGKYKFYSLSMILLAGLGPQGYGFTYSTPRGEVIEICSDQKENEAIIIKFKQYLKRKFLRKLEEELTNLSINLVIKKRIIDFLWEILKPRVLINYYNKDPILKKIRSYLYQIDEFQQEQKFELEVIINKISLALSVILRRIKLKDQFMTRMNLVYEGKIKSEDIAKLTSLRGKSHYDVLQERFFFQNEINWFFKDYAKEIKALEKKFSIFEF